MPISGSRVHGEALQSVFRTPTGCSSCLAMLAVKPVVSLLALCLLCVHSSMAVTVVTAIVLLRPACAQLSAWLLTFIYLQFTLIKILSVEL